MPAKKLALLLALLAAIPGPPAAAESSGARSARRALVVGIGLYRPPGADPKILAERRLIDLGGARNDAVAMTALLEARGYRVDTLVDGAASRAAILAAMREQLEEGAKPGDDVVFYFAGHGSQLASADPEEADRLDETLVPADAALGAPDLRDDELRERFGGLAARGVRLTVVIDACHSGSALRGLPGSTRSRSVAPPAPAARTVHSWAPAKTAGRLSVESGDSLVLAAAQDDQSAFETEDGRHGLFTRSLLEVLATAESGESAADSLRRVQSLILAGGRNQHPVPSGAPARLGQPIFAAATDAPRPAGPPGAAVIAVDGDLVRLEGGSAQGLREGDELARGKARIRLESVDPVRSRALRLEPKGPIAAGEIFVRQGGAARHQPDLTLFWSTSRLGAGRLLGLAEKIEGQVRASGRGWVADPWMDPPTHVLYFEEKRGWLLRGREGDSAPAGRSPIRALPGLLARLPAESKLFLQLPLPAGKAGRLALGQGSVHDAIEKADGLAAGSTYQLVGRVHSGRLLYSWSRSEVGDTAGDNPLPPRTRELAAQDRRELAEGLTGLALKLAAIRFWHRLEGPAESRFPYRLVLREPSTGVLVDAHAAAAGEAPKLRLGQLYGMALKADPPRPARRYVYVFVIGADGRRTLVFPRPGYGGENRLPLENKDSFDLESLVPFGAQPLIRIREPAGLETYVLLTTDEPLPDPMVLDASGVRAPRQGDHPLVRMLHRHHRGEKDVDGPPPVAWSIERLTVRVAAAPAGAAR